MIRLTAVAFVMSTASAAWAQSGAIVLIAAVGAEATTCLQVAPWWLEPFANVATFLTAVVAVVAYAGYRVDRKRKQWALERYLKDQKTEASRSTIPDRGQRSVLHLMAKLKFSEAEVLRAAFDSRHVDTRLGKDEESNLANAILFQYREKKS